MNIDISIDNNNIIIRVYIIFLWKENKYAYKKDIIYTNKKGYNIICLVFGRVFFNIMHDKKIICKLISK